jgi:hypothetical protein
MKSDYVVAGILVGAMVVGLGAYSAHPGDEYCPSPSAASVAKTARWATQCPGKKPSRWAC